MAGRHVQIGPGFGEILLLHAQDIQALGAGDLDHPCVIFFRNIGYSTKLIRVGDATSGAGHDGERAVVLDVAVDPVVYEAGVAFFLLAIEVNLFQNVRQFRLTSRTDLTGAARPAQLAYALYLALADDALDLRLRELHALAEVILLLFHRAFGDLFQDLLD